MTVGFQTDTKRDPLLTLRDYRNLAPWNLRDLAAMTAAVLYSSGVKPINAAATATPNERTIRFYVTRGLVSPPEGKGTSAIYHYRHLLQILFIKLRQMEGATLTAIGAELRDLTGDVLERRVAVALGPNLPPPKTLPFDDSDHAPSGRSARLFRPAPDTQASDEGTAAQWVRIPVSDGVELHVNSGHPYAHAIAVKGRDLAEAIQLVLGRVLE